jgi:hypothetical protein
MRKLGFSLFVALLGLSSTAEAHFILSAPPGVVANEGNGKGPPPCGPDTGAAATPTAVQGGKPLMIKVTETVGHPGFYRVALALKSRTEFPVDNVVYDKNNKVLPPNGMPSGQSDHADFMNPPVFPVLADNLFKHTDAPSGKVYMGTVDIPNVSCDRCILQVIEFMAQHGWNGSAGGASNGGYFYHHCAELKITPDPALPIFDPAGTPDGGAPPVDAKPDTGSTGAAGTTGAGGTAGNGTAGTGGGAAGTTGAAGSSVAGTGGGAAGTTGAAGSSSTGAAGTTGAAGSSAGTRGDDGGGGGCSVTGGGVSFASLLLGLATLVAVRRRRSA